MCGVRTARKTRKANRKMVIDEIKQILAKQLRIDANTINDNSNIIEDLGADSIDLVELLMTIEEKKGIVVSDEDDAIPDVFSVEVGSKAGRVSL